MRKTIRQGLGKKRGSGYKNIIPHYDSYIHTCAAHGISGRTETVKVPRRAHLEADGIDSTLSPEELGSISEVLSGTNSSAPEGLEEAVQAGIGIGVQAAQAGMESSEEPAFSSAQQLYETSFSPAALPGPVARSNSVKAVHDLVKDQQKAVQRSPTPPSRDYVEEALRARIAFDEGLGDQLETLTDEELLEKAIAHPHGWIFPNRYERELKTRLHRRKRIERELFEEASELNAKRLHHRRKPSVRMRNRRGYIEIIETHYYPELRVSRRLIRKQ